jgi:hypothetical protein
MGIVEGEPDHTGLSAWGQVLRRCSDDGSDLAASVIPSVIAWHQYPGLRRSVDMSGW